MKSYIDCKKLNIDSDCMQKLESLYQYYLKHRFNLLGSGWVKIDYELRAKGVCGKRYYSPYMSYYGKKVIKGLQKKVSGNYEPINWFLDYKSGFFFDPRKYNSLEKCHAMIGKMPGVDIKCPWELGRFYHLVQLAVLAYTKAIYKDDIILEFKNELIDFCKTNPIGRTVQWSITMDTSIRMVNLLVAHDIIKQVDDRRYLDADFEIKFQKHIYDSLKFVMNHLEYYGKGSGTNHYLSNLAGIIFAAAYLDSDEWTDACLVFGVQELIDQTQKQFYEEGANFEGSTSYHRLSAEFVLYSTAFVYGVLKTGRREAFVKYNSKAIDRLKRLNNQKYDIKKQTFFPNWYIDRLYNMGLFTMTITNSNYEITQIGDNDSGRFIKLTPASKGMNSEIRENALDHRTLLSAMGGLFINDDYSMYGKDIPLECSFIKAISGLEMVLGKKYNTLLVEYGRQKHIFTEYPYKKENILYENKSRDNLFDEIKINFFSKFGLVILHSNRMFLSMVIDTAQNAKYTGHTHNDKLSIELMVDGKYVTRDTGTYIYTAEPKVRDKFRSVNAHNTIHVRGKEQNVFHGTFDMKKVAKSQLIYCCKECIIAKVQYEGVEHIREVRIGSSQIKVIDYSNSLFTVSFKNKMYSPGYGEVRKQIINEMYR